MIKEYALEPEALVHTLDPLRLYENFGIRDGRAVVPLPDEHDWTSNFMRALSAEIKSSTGDKQRVLRQLETTMQHLSTTKPIAAHWFWSRDGVSWDGGKTWLENVLEEERRLWRFDAIIVENSSPPAVQPVDLNMALPAWQVPLDVEVPRTPTAIVTQLKPLLRRTKTFTLVDPHFSPPSKLGGNQFRFVNVLNAMLASLDPTLCTTARVFALEEGLVLPNKSKPPKFVDLAALKWACQKHIQVPPNITLQVILVKSKSSTLHKMHDRYLFTDFAGIKAGAGWDEGDGKVELTRMDQTFQKLRDDYELQVAYTWEQTITLP